MDETFLEELFHPFGPVTIRRMFGGQGIFHRGLMFALTVDGQLMLKADDETSQAFKDLDQHPFRYEKKTGQVAEMGYWSVPEYLLDDPDAFKSWAQTAFDVALRADNAKPPSKRKQTSLQE